jgi:hypothetical protein
MLLTITTTHSPATDLGFLLHKNPARLQSFDLVILFPVSFKEAFSLHAAGMKQYDGVYLYESVEK